jgi:acyl transferase domain-containing protein
VETKIFDLEKPFADQDFQPGSFDFIVGTNVLHAVADVRAALRNLYGLLAPGGSLVFMDVATPQLWTEAVFGLTSGWWRFTDRDLRSTHPLLDRAKWEELLQETGFGETASLPGLMGRYGEGQITLLARKSEDASAALEPVVQVPPEKSWLVFADAGGIGDALAARLCAAGASCKIVRRGSSFTAPDAETSTVRPDTLDDWRQLFQSYAAPSEPERIVYLWNLDLEFDNEAVFGTDALLHLAQALEAVLPAAKPRIDSITRGAQPVGRDPQPTAVAQAPALGLLRVILNEYPNLVCRSIDLPPATSAADLDLLWAELLRTESEREVALRDQARYVQRIDRGRHSIQQALDPAVPLRP